MINQGTQNDVLCIDPKRVLARGKRVLAQRSEYSNERTHEYAHVTSEYSNERTQEYSHVTSKYAIILVSNQVDHE